MKHTNKLLILIFSILLIFPSITFAEPYFKSDEYAKLSEQVIGNFTAITKGITLKKYNADGTSTDIINPNVGTKIHCNDQIMPWVGVSDAKIKKEERSFSIKSTKTNKIYHFKNESFFLFQIQQKKYEEKFLDKWNKTQDFICEDKNEEKEQISCIGEKCKGIITDFIGRVTIERDHYIFPAEEGTELLPGDVIITHDNAEVNFTLEDNEEPIQLIGRNKFDIPSEKKEPGIIYKIFGNLWAKLRFLLEWDNFELKEEWGTPVAGVRG